MSYHDFDGFIILHGTDTMAYTASALSFMLENLNKTVILTGVCLRQTAMALLTHVLLKQDRKSLLLLNPMMLSTT
jgi:L-asparaginase/Glu-tRNA(Gln) amidotransferase subunit D